MKPQKSVVSGQWSVGEPCARRQQAADYGLRTTDSKQL